jgi:hypothetical protein
MTYLNPGLGLLVIAVFVFAGILALEPTAALWLAQILIARARAVEDARKTFRRVRRCEIMLVQLEEGQADHEKEAVITE